ncbi:hypothetical protein ABTX34_32445 [Streptomyces sp. NPDC096538]|uniref:hypothetical protein n=1 Tax=Streptomyces sp. NPDC096538 TaxID=3155427 RepID=UPI003318950C
MGAMGLGRVGLDLAGGHALRDQKDHHLVGVGQDRFGGFAVAGVVGWIVLGMAGMVGGVASQSGLQQPLGQLLEQPALAGRLQALGRARLTS